MCVLKGENESFPKPVVSILLPGVQNDLAVKK